MKHKKIDSIKFKAEAIVYEEENSGFKIIRGTVYDESGARIIGDCSVKGIMCDIEEGDELLASGFWEEHPLYGNTFHENAYVKCVPRTKKSILNYLMQGNIAGISPSRAEKIVSRFGKQTFDVLIYKTHLLKEINGIGPKSIAKIQKSAKENLEQQNIMSSIMMYLQDFNITPAYARKIYEYYGIASMDVIKKNPYQLADDVKGIGFLKADEIALKNGIKKDSPFRIESAVLYTISQMNSDGDVYGTVKSVTQQCCDYLQLDSSYVDKAIASLIKSKRIICDDDALYLPELYKAETYAAKKLVQLSVYKGGSFNVSDTEIEQLSADVHITYADAQVKAIKKACQSNVIVITGGPGTGKTTVINGIIKMCKKQGLSVLCAAPTGKASKRMSEATGMDATTIHKLLELKYNEDNKKARFTRNEANPLTGDVLIIDESSMIDMMLFYAVLKAMPTDMKLILVGDVDQLPSVGCGNILYDIIASQIINIERLNVIYRQAEQSNIVKNAHLINNGSMPSLKNKRTGDFFFIDAQGMAPEDIRDKIVTYVCTNLPKCYNVTPDNIQVLAPMKKGHTGVYELNSHIQHKLNPPSKKKAFLTSDGNIFREGDKVMCISNDYENMVFNGDIGKITTIKKKINNFDDDNDEKYFAVDFDGKEIHFPLCKIDNFMLAYATTIHKSQGSEYDIVVMPLTNHNYIMLQRNLLYTGLTRAKKIFVLVGQKQAISRAVKTLKVAERNTRLDIRLKEEAGRLGLAV